VVSRLAQVHVASQETAHTAHWLLVTAAFLVQAEQAAQAESVSLTVVPILPILADTE